MFITGGAKAGVAPLWLAHQELKHFIYNSNWAFEGREVVTAAIIIM